MFETVNERKKMDKIRRWPKQNVINLRGHWWRGMGAS